MSLDRKLSVNHVYKILEYLKAEPKIESSGNISSRTVCHRGIGNGSRKLIYYENSKLFVCYTGCAEEHFGATKLVMKAAKVNYEGAVDIIERLTGVYDDFITYTEGFDEDLDELSEDLEYIKSNKVKENTFEVTKYDKKLLNSFYPLYHNSFLKDNISIESMKKFGVLFDVDKNRIIIPHYYHEDDSLIAIRCRNLEESLVELGLKYTPVKMEVGSKKIAIASKTGAYLYGIGRVAEAIKLNKIVILFESEKSVMQMETYYGKDNCAVATMGSFLSKRHIEILQEFNVEEVVIAYDKEYEVYGSKEDKLYRKKLRKRIIEKLLPHFKVSVIYDKWNYIGYKDSPSDHGRETFNKLFEKRFYITG